MILNNVTGKSNALKVKINSKDELIMKNYFIFFSLVFLFCNMYASRLQLQNGSCVDVPDFIVIHNDLEDDVHVYESDGFINLGHQLQTSKSLELDCMNLDIDIEVHQRNTIYSLSYPNKLQDDQACKSLKVACVFEYRLSDIVKGNKNDKGYTCVVRILEYMRETYSITFDGHICE